MNEEIILDGHLVAFSKIESGAKLNIVFLHGWRAESALWHPVVQELKDLKANLYLLDLPGFGRSPLPKTAFAVGDYADLVAKFIENKNLGPVVLVGHSVGGRISIKLTAMHPKLVSKLVLVDSAGFTGDEARRNVYGGIAKILKPFFKPKFMQGARKAAYKAIGSEDYVETPELQATYLKIVEEDLGKYLFKIKVPTLLFWGERDTETPLEFAERFEAGIKNAQLYILPGAGHFSFLDDPKIFARELKNFVGES